MSSDSFETPLDVAERLGHDKVAEFLRDVTEVAMAARDGDGSSGGGGGSGGNGSGGNGSDEGGIA